MFILGIRLDAWLPLMPVFTTAYPLMALLEQLAAEPAVLVEVQAREGSAPREVGAWMAVFRGVEIDKIGGGFEEGAIAVARALFACSAQGTRLQRRRVGLGPLLRPVELPGA